MGEVPLYGVDWWSPRSLRWARPLLEARHHPSVLCKVTQIHTHVGVALGDVTGFLAHKKTHPPQTLP